MIAVVADDLSGAAELAGISLRYGLHTELFTGNITASPADVIVLSTDSRSLKKEDALSVTRQALEQVLELNPTLIYKKIDSVLRGHVLDELELQMQMMKKEHALVMPANPSLGRIIKHGKYYINGTPINETSFASDPEFPAAAADIKEMLRIENIELKTQNSEPLLLHVLKSNEPLPATGIIIGESSNNTNSQAWAERVNDSFALAGAGDFFNALLHKQFQEKEQRGYTIEKPFLYICGTAYDQSVGFVRKTFENLHPVLFISEEMLDPEEMSIDAEVQDFVNAIQKKQKGVIAFDKELKPSAITAEDLRAIMASTVKMVIDKYDIKELLVEGGSTATAVLQELNIRHLQPLQELKRGVLRMQSNDLFITIKPGSYELPEQIIRLFE